MKEKKELDEIPKNNLCKDCNKSIVCKFKHPEIKDCTEYSSDSIPISEVEKLRESIIKLMLYKKVKITPKVIKAMFDLILQGRKGR
jgi:hypothetical protein